MSESVHCKVCLAPLPADALACPRCATAAPGSAPATPVPFRAEWTDGQRQAWKIEADSERVFLTGSQDRFEFSRSEWTSVITFSPTGPSVVLHFDAGDREIGFMVPMEEARRLFVAMGRGQQAAHEPQPPAAQESRTAAPTGAARRGPLWPKMSAMPVVALFCSVLAFLPVLGLLFAVVAIILSAISLRKARDNFAYLHIRKLAKVSLGISIVGLGICALGTYSLSQQSYDENVVDRFLGTHVEWSWGAGIAAIFMVIIALSVHEAAHAITAWWFGDGYARSVGRVTLNPLAHIDPFGTVLLPLMLALAGLPIFGYARPVPVQLGMVRRHRLAQILVSAAGPAANLLQAALCLAALMLIGGLLGFAADDVVVRNFSSMQPVVEIEGLFGGRVLAAVVLMLKLGFQINVMLAFFNLIPIPPLDGSWIAEHLSPRFVGRIYAAIRPYGFILFLGLLYTGVLGHLLLPGQLLTIVGMFMLTLVTGI